MRAFYLPALKTLNLCEGVIILTGLTPVDLAKKGEKEHLRRKGNRARPKKTKRMEEKRKEK